MMYRRNAAQTPRPDRIVAGGGASFLAMAAHQVLGYLASIGLYQQAEREKRRFDRFEKRARKHTTYFAAGLNGDRAVARRRRQRLKIEARMAAA